MIIIINDESFFFLVRDSLFIAACNSLTSIYAGFAIFSVIGFMAKQIDKPIDQAADQGIFIQLTFISI